MDKVLVAHPELGVEIQKFIFSPTQGKIKVFFKDGTTAEISEENIEDSDSENIITQRIDDRARFI